MNATDGLLGLALNLDQESRAVSSELDASVGGERDSGVHVDDAHQLSKSLVSENSMQHDMLDTDIQT